MTDDVPILVEPSWLSERLEDKTLKILDGSWYLPDAGRNPQEEFKKERIPGSQFFDMNKVADLSSSLPHMLPSSKVFASVMDSLAISNTDTVVVYDRAGIFSAPRIFWTFQAFGHSKVAVLNGGYPAWQAQSFPVDQSEASDEVIGRSAHAAQNPKDSLSYKAVLQESLVRSKTEVLSNLESKEAKVIDARGAPRFEGKAAEPRPGMRSGHIPSSSNVPFPKILQDGRYKGVEDLRKVFSEAGIDWEQPVISSCGSGVTACILYLGLQQVDPNLKVSVYDGSWSEWGSSKDTPIEQG